MQNYVKGPIPNSKKPTADARGKGKQVADETSERKAESKIGSAGLSREALLRVRYGASRISVFKETMEPFFMKNH